VKKTKRRASMKNEKKVEATGLTVLTISVIAMIVLTLAAFLNDWPLVFKTMTTFFTVVNFFTILSIWVNVIRSWKDRN